MKIDMSKIFAKLVVYCFCKQHLIACFIWSFVISTKENEQFAKLNIIMILSVIYIIYFSYSAVRKLGITLIQRPEWTKIAKKKTFYYKYFWLFQSTKVQNYFVSCEIISKILNDSLYNDLKIENIFLSHLSECILLFMFFI